MSQDEFVLEESEEFIYIPDGEMMVAQVTEVNRKVNKFLKNDDGSEVEQIEFKFQVIEDNEYLGRFVYGKTSTKFVTHADCKLRQWVQELFGVNELEPGFRFSLADLVGKQAKVVIGLRTYQKNGLDRQTNFVSDVIRANYGRATASVAAAPAPGSDEEPF